MSLLDNLDVCRELIKDGTTYKQIVEKLRYLFPGLRGSRGISVRSVRRYCAAQNLHATSRLSNKDLDVLVAFGIGTVSYLATYYFFHEIAAGYCSHSMLSLLC